MSPVAGAEGVGRSPNATRMIAVLTCHNRRPLTIACLCAFEESARKAAISPEAVVVDDASSDGTARALRRDFTWVELIEGGGNLYWNRGMHLGFGRALERGADYYLWINDDTVLLPDAVDRLLDQAVRLRAMHGKSVIVVGATAERASGTISYGGSVARSRFKRFTYRRVWSEREAMPCDTMNGNCVLLPRDVAESVGNLDPAFEHAMGDTDYALRAQRAGFRVYVAPGVVGYCSSNPDRGTFSDETLPLAQRWRSMLDRKGLPVRSWLHFTRKHGGPLWPMYFSWPYAKVLWSGIRGRWM